MKKQTTQSTAPFGTFTSKRCYLPAPYCACGCCERQPVETVEIVFERPITILAQIQYVHIIAHELLCYFLLK